MARMKKGEKGHEEAISKWHETMMKRFGSEEAISGHFKNIGRIGGANGHDGGFASNKELARIAGAKGGRLSKRGESKKTKELLEKNKILIIEMLSRDCPIKEISRATGISEGTLYRRLKKGLLYV